MSVASEVLAAHGSVADLQYFFCNAGWCEGGMEGEKRREPLALERTLTLNFNVIVPRGE